MAATPPPAPSTALAWRAHSAAPAVPAVELIVEAAQGERHERVVVVGVGLVEGFDELGHQRRRRPSLVRFGIAVERGVGREVVAGGVGLPLEQAPPHRRGGLRFEDVDDVADRHVLGEDRHRLRWHGEQGVADQLLDLPLPLGAVPERGDEVGAHERERSRPQRRQRPGVPGQPLVEVAQPVCARLDVEDRQEGTLLGEAEEPLVLLPELGVRVGGRPEVGRGRHHEVDGAPVGPVVVVGADAHADRVGRQDDLELDGDAEDPQQLRMVAEEGDELVEVPLRIAGFLEALAALARHRRDVGGRRGGAVAGEHLGLGQRQRLVARRRTGRIGLGERGVEVEDRLGEVTARPDLQAFGAERPPVLRAVPRHRRVVGEHGLPRRRLGERGDPSGHLWHAVDHHGDRHRVDGVGPLLPLGVIRQRARARAGAARSRRSGTRSVPHGREEAGSEEGDGRASLAPHAAAKAAQ